MNSPVNIVSDFEYILGKVQGNLLDFTTIFQSMEWTRGELELMARELEDTAKYFGEQQGLNPSGNLLSNTKATVRGNIIDFENKATNDRGQFYAGHIEYGHYARDGKTFVEARPFMRPALYAVSRASQGNIRDILAELLIGTFAKNGAGYQGLNNLRFGHKLGSKYQYSAPSNLIRTGMLNSKIGKEGFNLQENYIKKTGVEWSPMRGKSNFRNRSLMKEVGWDSSGRNVHRRVYGDAGTHSKVSVKKRTSVPRNIGSYSQKDKYNKYIKEKIGKHKRLLSKVRRAKILPTNQKSKPKTNKPKKQASNKVSKIKKVFVEEKKGRMGTVISAKYISESQLKGYESYTFSKKGKYRGQTIYRKKSD